MIKKIWRRLFGKLRGGIELPEPKPGEKSPFLDSKGNLKEGLVPPEFRAAALAQIPTWNRSPSRRIRIPVYPFDGARFGELVNKVASSELSRMSPFIEVKARRPHPWPPPPPTRRPICYWAIDAGRD